MKVICGDANPNGNIAFFYKGGCKKELNTEDSYRCTGCGGWFHLDCIMKHFQEEEGHDNARYALKQIRATATSPAIRALCDEGLKQNKPVTKLNKIK